MPHVRIWTPEARVQYAIDYLAGWAYSPVTDADTSSDLLDAIEAIKSLVPAPEPKADPAALKALIDVAEFRPSVFDNPGNYASVAYVDAPQAVTAVAWECYQCRDGVGWEKKAWLDREGVTVTLSIECGHCGSVSTYDAEGNAI